MGLFKSLNSTSKDGMDKGKNFVDASYNYFKLKSFYTASRTISTLLKLFLIGVFALVGIFFLAIALATFLGAYFQNVVLGYVVVGLLFLLFGFVVFLIRKKIDTLVIAKVADKFMK